MVTSPEMPILAILFASLVGSPHCAGMCGGFVALYSCKPPKSTDSEPPLHRALPHFAYHGGRLMTYTLLGAIAGYIGSRIDNVGVIIGMQRLSSLVVGVILILWGTSRLFPNTFGRIKLGAWFHKAHLPFRLIISKQRHLSHSSFALLLGASSTLLPCGWLYMFVTASTASGSWAQGAIVMAVFWLGTVPILSGLALLAGFVSEPAMRVMPRLSAVLVILAGIFSLGGHLDLLPSSLHQHNHHMTH